MRATARTGPDTLGRIRTRGKGMQKSKRLALNEGPKTRISLKLGSVSLNMGL